MSADQAVCSYPSPCAKIAPVEHLNTPSFWSDPVGGQGTLQQGQTWRILRWPQLDSTNAAAQRLLQKIPAQSLHLAHQTVISSGHQTQGKGQQSRPWHSEPNADLSMTVVLTKGLPNTCPFALNLAVSLAVLEGTESALPNLATSPWEIKWPNDLMLRGKKAGGILIENSWRGAQWSSAVVGIGLNLAGIAPYPNATRLLKPDQDPLPALDKIQSLILDKLHQKLAEVHTPEILLRQFHERLLGWGKAQRWQLDGKEIRGVLESISLQGKLCVMEATGQNCYSPGEVGWLGMEPKRI
jgi:BirA family biotin operon repressor/biotin-[acetyl-CoA-carboxylase] ligase